MQPISCTREADALSRLHRAARGAGGRGEWGRRHNEPRFSNLVEREREKLTVRRVAPRTKTSAAELARAGPWTRIRDRARERVPFDVAAVSGLLYLRGCCARARLTQPENWQLRCAVLCLPSFFLVCFVLG